jgi:hypothetical protein
MSLLFNRNEHPLVKPRRALDGAQAVRAHAGAGSIGARASGAVGKPKYQNKIAS